MLFRNLRWSFLAKTATEETCASSLVINHGVVRRNNYCRPILCVLPRLPVVTWKVWSKLSYKSCQTLNLSLLMNWSDLCTTLSVAYSLHCRLLIFRAFWLIALMRWYNKYKYSTEIQKLMSSSIFSRKNILYTIHSFFRALSIFVKYNTTHKSRLKYEI